MLAVSLAFISIWAESWKILVFLALAIVGSYFLIMLAHFVLPRSQMRRWIGSAIAVAILAIVPALNALGWIGTLTGNKADQISLLPWLLGMPFLALQIAGVARDVVSLDSPLPDLLDYSLLLVFFPKFLSGPLEKTTIVADFTRLRPPDGATLELGFGLILLGLFMKFTIGNQVSQLVDLNLVAPPALLISVIAFELRVYFDLAGYSFMAIGIAKLVGVSLTNNFNHPFFASNIRDFWKRWHISLGRWFHDTFYQIFLDRSYKSKVVSVLLPLVVFVTSALWHGASRNFLLWGMFHGLCFVAYTQVFRHLQFPKVAGTLAMLSVILFGRLLFMDSDYARLLMKVANLANYSAWTQGMTTVMQSLEALPNWKSGLGGLAIALIFLGCEGLSLRLYPDKPYAIFLDRRAQIVMLVFLLVFTSDLPSGFIYARQ